MNQLFTFLFFAAISFCSSANTISVTFQNSPHGSWTADAETAFLYAAAEWEDVLYSPREIKVIAYFEDLVDAHGGDASYQNVLGYASPKYSASNFTSSDPKYQTNTSYPIALADKLIDQNTHFSGLDYHIEIHMNSKNVNWHFEETYTAGPSERDFISVCMHELGHGLGFTGTCAEDGGTISYHATLPSPYDREIYRINGSTLLTSLASTGQPTTNFLTSDELSFNGLKARTANGSPRPEIYAPTSYNNGSSIYHWNKDYFGVPNADALMHLQAQFTNRYFHRSIGDVTEALMEDIGWTLGTSVEELGINNFIKVFPNPSNDQVKIQASNITDDFICVKLVDVSGKVVQKTKHSNDEATIDVSRIECGIYFVNVYLDSNQYIGTTKLIVN